MMDKRWQEISLAPSQQLRDALSVIDAGALRLALVTDAEGMLLGTLSDGDVRRALIHGYSLDAPVDEVMNRRPKTVDVTTDREEVFAIMSRHDLLVIPVIDASGRMVGLYSHKEMLHTVSRDNWVFLMAGGFGTRLRPLTDQCPKPMLKVGGRPLLQVILESYMAAGFHKFYISVHYMADVIKEHFGDGRQWNVTIRYIEETNPLGTGGALGLLPTVEDLPLLMMNGDILTKVDIGQLLRFHEENQSAITMCVREYDFTVPYGVVETSGRHVTTITEKPVHRFFVNAGIYVLNPDVVASVGKDSKLDMTDLAERLMKQGRDVSVFPIHEYWLDIGRPDDFVRAQEEVGPLIK